jgi:hypothetical protein
MLRVGYACCPLFFFEWCLFNRNVLLYKHITFLSCGSREEDHQIQGGHLCWMYVYMVPRASRCSEATISPWPARTMVAVSCRAVRSPLTTFCVKGPQRRCFFFLEESHVSRGCPYSSSPTFSAVWFMVCTLPPLPSPTAQRPQS